MKTVPLTAQYRSQLGKSEVRKIRSQKRIPAVVYGSGVEPTPIHVSADDFLRAIRTKAGENVVIDLKVGGTTKRFEKTVVIKEIQHHLITDAVQHVDFQVISLKEKITLKVPLRLQGESIGVKDGGVLDVVHHEIEVACLPTDIPERLDVDIAALKIGDSIHVSEMVFPEGVVSTLPQDEVVVAIHVPKVEEVSKPEEEVPTEPELVGKEKKAEGEEVAAPEKAEKAAKAEKPAAEEAKKEKAGKEK